MTAFDTAMEEFIQRMIDELYEPPLPALRGLRGLGMATNDAIVRQSDIKEHVIGCDRKAWMDVGLDFDQPVQYRREPAIGTIVHAYLASYYQGGGPSVRIQAAERETRALSEEYDIEIPEDDYRLALHLGEETVEWIESEAVDAGWKVQAVESDLSRKYNLYTSSRNLTLTGRADLILTDGSYTKIVDWKVVGRFTPLDRMDFQLLTYAWLLTDGEEDVLIEQRQIKRNERTARAKPPFHQVYTHVVDREAVRLHGARLKGVYLDHMPENEGWKTDPNANPKAWVVEKIRNSVPARNTECSWRCPHYELCATVEEVADMDDLVQVVEINGYSIRGGE